MSGIYQEGQRIPFVLINLRNQNFYFDGQDAKILRQHKVNDGMNLNDLMTCLSQISSQTYQKFTDHGLANLAQVLELTRLADQVMVKNVDLIAQKGFVKNENGFSRFTQNHQFQLRHQLSRYSKGLAKKLIS